VRRAARHPGREQIFVDKISSKLARRPELDKALLVARRSSDQLVMAGRVAAMQRVRFGKRGR
jgi:hypothetical protein